MARLSLPSSACCSSFAFVCVFLHLLLCLSPLPSLPKHLPPSFLCLSHLSRKEQLLPLSSTSSRYKLLFILLQALSKLQGASSSMIAPLHPFLPPPPPLLFPLLHFGAIITQLNWNNTIPK